MTSVIVRSSANANAGATHKTSAVFHGVLLLMCINYSKCAQPDSPCNASGSINIDWI